MARITDGNHAGSVSQKRTGNHSSMSAIYDVALPARPDVQRRSRASDCWRVGGLLDGGPRIHVCGGGCHRGVVDRLLLLRELYEHNPALPVFGRPWIVAVLDALRMLRGGDLLGRLRARGERYARSCEKKPPHTGAMQGLRGGYRHVPSQTIDAINMAVPAGHVNGTKKRTSERPMLAQIADMPVIGLRCAYSASGMFARHSQAGHRHRASWGILERNQRENRSI